MKKIICSFLLLCFHHLAFCQSDTVIFNARLIDTVTEHAIEYLPDHIALSILFETTYFNKTIFSIALFAPERFPKDFFRTNNIYTIYGHSTKGKYVFQPVSKSSNIISPMMICDSLFLSK